MNISSFSHRLRLPLIIILIIGLVTPGWAAAHVHLGTAHEHGADHHAHAAEVHTDHGRDHHPASHPDVIDTAEDELDSGGTSHTLAVVELGHDYDPTGKSAKPKPRLIMRPAMPIAPPARPVLSLYTLRNFALPPNAPERAHARPRSPPHRT